MKNKIWSSVLTIVTALFIIQATVACDDKKGTEALGFLALLGLGNNGGGGNNGDINTTPTVTYSGSAYSYVKGSAISAITPTITGTPLTNCVASPALPDGLSIEATNCVISGTPTAAQSATDYIVTASNSYGNGTTILSIEVTTTGTSPTITYSGSPYSLSKDAVMTTITPTLTGTTLTTCTSSPTLPTGLSIDNASCAISGTPTTVQSAAIYTVTATNAYGSGTANISITVTATGSAPVVSYSGSPFSYTQNSAITSITPTLSGNTPTSCTASPSLPSGLSIAAATCVISGTPTVTQSATTYTITATNAYGSGSDNISITVSAAGSAPAVSYSGSPFSFVKDAAITTITATLGGTAPTSCTASPTLPDGLAINNTNCAISGNPTTVQSAANYTVTASNWYGNGSATISIEVTENGTAPTVSYAGSPFSFSKGSVITTISPTLTGTTPTTCTSAPTLPAGLSIDNASCAISGTPSVSMTAATYTVTATNVFGSGSATISIEVTAYTADFMNDAAEFTFVKPGLGYTCSLEQTSHTMTRVILTEVHLPPSVASPRMGVAQVVAEIPWTHPVGYPQYPYSGAASCGIAAVHDESGGDVLFLAYDYAFVPENYYHVQRELSYAVIPLGADGSAASKSTWTYHYPDADGWNSLARESPQVHVGAINDAVHVVYHSEMIWQGTSDMLHLYFANVADMVSGTYSRQIPRLSCTDGEPTLQCGCTIKGSVDAEVQDGKYVMTWLNFTDIDDCFGTTASFVTFDGESWTMKNDLQPYYNRYGQRTDANIYTNPLQPDDDTWLHGLINSSNLINQVFRRKFSMLANTYEGYIGLNNGWWYSESSLNANATNDKLFHRNRHNAAWDSIVYGTDYITVQRSAAGGFALFTVPASGSTAIENNLTMVTRAWPRNPYAKLQGTYVPADDLPPYYSNTQCQYEPGEIDTTPITYLEGCNNLLKMYLYQPDLSGPEKLLLMYTNSSDMLTFREVALPLNDIPAGSYMLSYLSWGNGTIEGDTTQMIASGGSGTAVTAVPDSGYRFKEWTDGSTQNPRTDANITADKPLTAYFELIP